MAAAQIPILPDSSRLQGAPAGAILPRSRFKVWVKKKWSGDAGDADAKWTLAPYLVPVAATIAAAPLKSSATFRWHAGRIKREDGTLFRDYGRLADLKDYFVKVEVLSPGYPASPLFVGRIAVDETGYDGADTGSWTRANQTLTALGLEHELDRSPIRGAYVTNGVTKDPTTHEDKPATSLYIDKSIVFNEEFDGLGPTDVGNRSVAKIALSGQDDVTDDNQKQKEYVFAGLQATDSSPDARTTWTVGDIVEYLLRFYAPKGVPFYVGGQPDALSEFILPTIDVGGRTLFQALNYLIDRRRGLGWCLRPGLARDGKDAVEIHVYSLLDEPITYHSGDDGKRLLKLPKNTEETSLNLDKLGHLVDEQTVTFDTLATFGKVVVSGAPLLVCFTAYNEPKPKDDGSASPPPADITAIIKGWSDDDEAKYKTAAGKVAGDTDAAKLNDQDRADVKRQHVFCHFNLNPEWGWRAEGHNCNPFVGEAGYVQVDEPHQPPIRRWGLKVNRFLPFKASSSSEDPDVGEYERPFVILFDDATGRWVQSHHPGAGPSASLTPLHTSFGFSLNFETNHVLAKGSWSGANPSQLDPDDPGKGYEWTKMRATIAVRTDTLLQVSRDISNAEELKDRVLQIVIPDAELHYVVPGTIRGIKKTEGVGSPGPFIVTTKDEAIVRNDGDRLRHVAELARAWYGKERTTVRVTLKQIDRRYQVGMMLRSVSTGITGGQQPGSRVRVGKSRAVNTAISSVTYDLLGGTTTIGTSFVELDVTPPRSVGRKRT